MDFEVTFVVSGATVDDDDAVEALEAIDAMLFRGAGVDLLTMTGVGDNAVVAARTAAVEAINLVPRLRVHRVDRDLVGVPEIAERIGRSRQNVSQWIKGERQVEAGPFPQPEGTAGRSKVWLWSEVNAWLREVGLDDGNNYPTRSDMTLIDHALLTMLTMTFTFDNPDDAYHADRQRIAEAIESPEFADQLRQLAEKPTTLDEQKRHVIVIASPDEPAAEAMERILSHGHDVVLMTVTDRIFAVVMSTNLPPIPKELVPVSPDSTVGDWVDLMWNHPNAAFVLSSAGQATPEAGVFRNAA